MSYLVDLGYRKRKLIFPTIGEANGFCNEVMRKTKEVLTVTETDKMETHNYRETDNGKVLCRIQFSITGFTNKNEYADINKMVNSYKSAMRVLEALKEKCECVVVRMEDVLVDKENCNISVSSPVVVWERS